VSTLERLERIAQRLEAASELTGPSRSVDYLAGAAAVRAEIRAQQRGEEQILWHRLRAVELLSERLADSAPPDSEEQRLADGCSLGLEGLREDLGWSA
jgi:hypothetical protein